MPRYPGQRLVHQVVDELVDGHRDIEIDGNRQRLSGLEVGDGDGARLEEQGAAGDVGVAVVGDRPLDAVGAALYGQSQVNLDLGPRLDGLQRDVAHLADVDLDVAQPGRRALLDDQVLRTHAPQALGGIGLVDQHAVGQANVVGAPGRRVEAEGCVHDGGAAGEVGADDRYLADDELAPARGQADDSCHAAKGEDQHRDGDPGQGAAVDPLEDQKVERADGDHVQEQESNDQERRGHGYAGAVGQGAGNVVRVGPRCQALGQRCAKGEPGPQVVVAHPGAHGLQRGVDRQIVDGTGVEALADEKGAAWRTSEDLCARVRRRDPGDDRRHLGDKGRAGVLAQLGDVGGGLGPENLHGQQVAQAGGGAVGVGAAAEDKVPAHAHPAAQGLTLCVAERRGVDIVEDQGVDGGQDAPLRGQVGQRQVRDVGAPAAIARRESSQVAERGGIVADDAIEIVPFVEGLDAHRLPGQGPCALVQADL